MINNEIEKGEYSRRKIGECMRVPFELITTPESRAAHYPYLVYAQPSEYESEHANSWVVNGIYPNFRCVDEGGWEAYRLGAWYYREGMSIHDAENLNLRIDCFRAAELFYLHAAAAGNIQALINLGYVYSYDRCEGMFWPGWKKYDLEDFSDYPADERAYEVLLAASEHDFAEAHYKLGDMIAAGRGCDQDDFQAFLCYSKAYNLAHNEEPTIAGSCAYRLAVASEKGMGCAQSFHEALFFYQEASQLLGRAVAFGESYYKGVLGKSKLGIRRMEQEISGQY